MQFNSYIFILVFMPLTIVLYFLLNKINLFVGKVFLLIASIVFYTFSDWKVFFAIGISIVINYAFAILLERGLKWRKLYMFLPVAVNIGLLFYFKYLNFKVINIGALLDRKIEIENSILPVGISFFTFQQIAYIGAIYKKEIEKVALIDYLVYIFFFPKVLMGPLIEPTDFISQINNSSLKKINWDNISYGLKIFCYGLLKKWCLPIHLQVRFYGHIPILKLLLRWTGF